VLVARTAIVARADKEEKGCREVLTGVGFLEAPACHLLVSGIRTPKILLLLLWEKWAEG
jgi:hypothetical protein